MTWNIWHGKYLPGIIQYLKTENPDVIGLQEVIEQKREGKQFNIAESIANELGYNFIYFKAFHTDRHHPEYDLGNAILSRFPISSSEVIELSSLTEYQGSADTEPRVVIRTEITVSNVKFTIFNTHLGYSQGFEESQIRNRQVKKLISLFRENKVILLGDFNSLPESSTVQMIAQVLESADKNLKQKTWSVYPANYRGFKVNGLEYRIDYIFTSRDVEVLQTYVGETRASDHLPVISEIKI